MVPYKYDDDDYLLLKLTTITGEKCLSTSVCVHLSAAQLKMNDPKVPKLGVGHDLGIS